MRQRLRSLLCLAARLVACHIAILLILCDDATLYDDDYVLVIIVGFLNTDVIGIKAESVQECAHQHIELNFEWYQWMSLPRSISFTYSAYHPCTELAPTSNSSQSCCRHPPDALTACCDGLDRTARDFPMQCLLGKLVEALSEIPRHRQIRQQVDFQGHLGC